MKGKAKSALFPILTVNFIGTLGYSLILPFLIFLIYDFGGNEVIYGLVGATYSAFQLIGAPILGSWSDSIERRKVLIISQAGTFIAWLLFIVALLYPVETIREVENGLLGKFILTVPLIILFLARALDGLTGGNVSVANAYLADITSEKDRKKNFGKMSVAGNLGFIVGPVLAGLLASTKFEELIPVSVAALISLVAMGFILRLPKTNEKSKSVERAKSIEKVLGQEHCDDTRNPKRKGWLAVLRLPYVPYVLLLYFLIFMGFNIFYTAFPVHASTTLKWSSLELGIYFSVLSLLMIGVQGPVLSKINDHFSDYKLYLVGSSILAISFLFLLSEQLILIYTSAFFFALGNGLMWPSFQSIFSKIGGKDLQSALQGIGGSVASLASIAGLIGGGLLYQNLGAQAFSISFIVILLVFLISFKLKKVVDLYEEKS